MLGLESWTLARPEIFLAAATTLLLLYGVLRGEASVAFVSLATSVALRSEEHTSELQSH